MDAYEYDTADVAQCDRAMLTKYYGEGLVIHEEHFTAPLGQFSPRQRAVEFLATQGAAIDTPHACRFSGQFGMYWVITPSDWVRQQGGMR